MQISSYERSITRFTFIIEILSIIILVLSVLYVSYNIVAFVSVEEKIERIITYFTIV